MCPGRGERVPEGSLWLVDLALQPHLLALDLPTYWRMMLAHLGMPQWHFLVAGIGLTPWAKVRSEVGLERDLGMGCGISKAGIV